MDFSQPRRVQAHDRDQNTPAPPEISSTTQPRDPSTDDHSNPVEAPSIPPSSSDFVTDGISYGQQLEEASELSDLQYFDEWLSYPLDPAGVASEFCSGI